MSQDIFGSLESGSEEEAGGTPIEFSGVSGNASSRQESPASQPQKSQTPPVAPLNIQSLASSTTVPQVFQCPVCKRKLKTENGFAKHVANHNVDGLPGTSQGTEGMQTRRAAPAAGARPGTSQGTESMQTHRTAAPAASSRHSAAVPSTMVKAFLCPDCQKTLKTEGGYLKHRASHKLKDANKRKPDEEKLKLVLKDIMDRISDEIISEPVYNEAEGTAKTAFLQEFKNNYESEQWVSFVSSLSEFIFFSVVEDCSKILPQNQYEEVQQKLQAHLCNEDNMYNHAAKLGAICEVKLSTVKLRRLVFRISLKLLYEIQAWVAQEMQSARQQDNVNLPRSQRTEIEKKAFSVNLGEIFRGFYKKSMVSLNSQWQGRSSCLSDTFVDGQFSISSSQFLNKETWFSGDLTCIVPSEHAVHFFFAVESAMQAVSVDNEVTDESVIEYVMGDFGALNIWFYLTASHFSEACSLLFMNDLIHVFIKRSLLLEERLRNRVEEKSVRATQASLRTHLKRNYTSKEHDADLIE